MKRVLLLLLYFFLLHRPLTFADDMTFTTRYFPEKSGFMFGVMPKNIPDKLGYKGSQTTITPLLISGNYSLNDLYFGVVLPMIVNPDDSTDDIMLNTILLDTGYNYYIDQSRLTLGIQFTPALNLGSNKVNDLSNTLSCYLGITTGIIENLSYILSIQYYHSLEDKRRYTGLYITRANSGFSIEMKLEYLFLKEQIAVLSDLLLYRDISNGVSNIYISPGVKFVLSDSDTINTTLSIPVYDKRFTDKFGSGLNLYYDRRF